MDVETHNDHKPSLKDWLGAMRLRTLPLALASTLTGTAIAYSQYSFDGLILLFTALTTMLLQINSNLANDYGDFQHGTDNDARIGPSRAIQSGKILPKQMFQAIVICTVLALISGTTLVWLAPISIVAKLVLFVLGCAAIGASIKYTAGKNPYGYRGLGDLSVVVFFGFLGVVGSYFVQVGSLNFWVMLPAITIGGLSAGVLNINNMRDADTDALTGKTTLAVRLGYRRSKIYQVTVVALALDAMLIYAWLHFDSITNWLFVLAYPILLLNLMKVYAVQKAKDYDQYLKPLAIGTFVLSVLLILGAII